MVNVSDSLQLIPTDSPVGFHMLCMRGHSDAAKAHARTLGYYVP